MNKKNMTVVVLILFVFVIVSYTFRDIKELERFEKITFEDWLWDKLYVPTNSAPMVDKVDIYGDDFEDIKVEKMYVTVLPTKDKDGNEITFDDLNSIYDWRIESPDLNMNLAKEENIDANISKNIEANGIITLRGHSTIENQEKSYKLKISEEKNKWHQMDTIHLNKHPFDRFRVRNKIAFDLLELVPDIISIRTRFVELYIRDLSESEDANFENYGLFTNVEETNNKNFLKEHGLDPDGSLYKVEEFEFLPYEELKDYKDIDYKEDRFEKRLEIKTSKSHKKIIEMNRDVNNYNLDIDKVLDKHFNRENYFTWLATNILLGNYDTQTQNFFLYSPHDSLAWYFIPWDYDGSMGEDKTLQYDKEGRFIALLGVANYWNSTLHQRVFQNPDNINELNNKIEEVYKILSKDKIEEVVEKYRPIVESYFLEDPNYIAEYASDGIKKAGNELNEFAEEIINSTTINRDLYYEQLNNPMPIYLGAVYKDEEREGYVFEWTESYDLQGDRISYTLEISDSLDFDNIIMKSEKIKDNFTTIDIEPGDYYWRITVYDEKGNSQRALDIYEVDSSLKYFGVAEISLD